MKKIWGNAGLHLATIAMACLALTSCLAPAPSGSTTLRTPAPLASTALDEKALIIALQSYDTVLTLVDQAMAAGIVKPGTPRALQLRSILNSAKGMLDAAGVAQRAGDGGRYAEALAQFPQALADIRTMMKEGR